MEYLDRSEWEALDRFMNTSSTVLSRTELRKAPEAIVSALKSKNYVYGDLWPHNIMIYKDLLKQIMTGQERQVKSITLGNRSQKSKASSGLVKQEKILRMVMIRNYHPGFSRFILWKSISRSLLLVCAVER